MGSGSVTGSLRRKRIRGGNPGVGVLDESLEGLGPVLD